MKKKTLFEFNIDNVVDIITNSSSELFVLEGQTQEIVEEMLVSVYPEYLDEYEQVVSMKNMTKDKVEWYLSYKYDSYDWNDKNVDTKYKSIEGVKPKDLYENWEDRNNPENKYFWPIFSESAIELLKSKIDPHDEKYFLFSIDENPNWDYQEKLSDIGIRYHLG